jgi:hypothetical protein
MNITSVSLHQIDQSKNELIVREVGEASKELNHYISSLITDIFESGRHRDYEFQSDTKEVCAALGRVLDDGDFAKEAQVIAARLLKSEVDAQAEIAHLQHPIPKGSLVQAVLSDGNGQVAIAISKADHTAILDEETFEERHGLPLHKKVFKAALVDFDDKKAVKSVKVYETVSAKYWWGTFLELNEKRSDSLNTKTALQKIDEKVFRPLKKTYPADHLIIRNSAIGYFRTKPEFELGEFLDTLIKDYTPVDESFPSQKVRDGITKLQQDEQFDRRFTIDSKAIPIRQRSTDIWLRDDVKISFLGDLDNRQVATRSEDQEGNKFVKIRVSENAYELFPDE